MHTKRTFTAWLAFLGALIFTLSITAQISSKADTTIIPDISEWQGKLTSTKVANLKNQVSFIINRRQYGANYQDKYATNNTNLYVKYGIPFGEYDYSTFTSAASAKTEAKTFYANSNKNAKFYVLDFEENDVHSGTTNNAVKAWYNQMRSLTDKKLIFYSYQSFATTYANSARQKFDAQWIANYSARPTITTDLWQYSNKKYVPALKESIDASTILNSDKPISWWVGDTELHTALNDSAYYQTSIPKVTATKTIYLYNSTTFNTNNREKKVPAGTQITISGIHQRSTGSYYFSTSDGHYITANKAYITE
ncbi:GH25 family lysozyme [Lentilactobacillus sp. SPB1-3]|uniref:GH25 family lysozyme n=1 Tax=Lentilactobacillus terminaliae TaxID=3003483 RepID=A0ACD5DEQ1_9LACO